MTTPPQPQNHQTSHSNNHHHHSNHHHQQQHQHHSTSSTTTTGTNSTSTTPTAGRSRKRPAPGTSVPLLSSIPVTSAGPQPSSTSSPSSLPASQSMNYLGLPQQPSSSSAPISTLTSSAGSGANLYSTVPLGNTTTNGNSLIDAYRATRSAVDPTSSLNLPGATDTNSQIALINRGTNTLVRMPYNPVPSGAPGMNMMGTAGGGGIGLGQVIGPPGQSDGLDSFDRELQMRIDKMRKKRASIPPFVQKLSSFVNDPKTDALIRWSPSGNSFLVLDEDEFSKTLIPDLFKHNNYASFVRQLNMYGFHKVVGLADGSLKTSEQRSKPPSEYENPYFKRGQPDLMWLISKPKGKGKRKNTKTKQEDSDNLEDMSDGGEDFEGGGGGGGGRGYIEGPKVEGQDGGGHHQQSGGRRPDISALIQQLEAVRNHQAMISAAINRLRKDHNQLYEQSVAFQTLHDRHENSINAILTFLATVYDKSLGGNINGTFSNLFQNQVEHAQALHPQGVGAVVGNVGGAIVTPNRQSQRVPSNQMTRRRQQLLLENGPMAGQISEEDSPKPQVSPINKTNGASMKPMGSPIIQNYQTYQSPSIQELAPSLSQDGTRQQQQQETQYATRQPQPYANIFSLPDSPIAPLPSPNMNRPSASPVSSHSLTPRLFPRSLVTPGLSSQTLQDHNAQLAQKAREIEELEELQAAQNSNVDELMDMMNKFADTDAEHAGQLHNGNSLDGTGGNIDEFLNWGIPGDLNGDGSMGGAFTGVDGDGGLQGSDDLNALFTFQAGDDAGVMGGGIGVDGVGVGQVLGTNPSTVVASPAGSNASRAREELEEEVEEVQVKRRRIGEGGDELGVDELEKGLGLLAAAVVPAIVPEEDVV